MSSWRKRSRGAVLHREFVGQPFRLAALRWPHAAWLGPAVQHVSLISTEFALIRQLTTKDLSLSQPPVSPRVDFV